MARYEGRLPPPCVCVTGPAENAGPCRSRGGGVDAQRRFAYTLVEDRELCLRAARAMMLRIAGATG
jgi:hypothetical protein